MYLCSIFLGLLKQITQIIICFWLFVASFWAWIMSSVKILHLYLSKFFCWSIYTCIQAKWIVSWKQNKNESIVTYSSLDWLTSDLGITWSFVTWEREKREGRVYKTITRSVDLISTRLSQTPRWRSKTVKLIEKMEYLNMNTNA